MFEHLTSIGNHHAVAARGRYLIALVPIVDILCSTLEL